MLSRETAAEIGRNFRFLRHAREMTLRDVSKTAGISPQYLQNIEAGIRTAVSREVWLRLGGCYGVDENVTKDLLLKAAVLTALEERELSPEQRMAGWNALIAGLAAVGVRVETDISREVSKLL